MRERQYIYCPRCKLDGRIKKIAEFFPDGSLAIERTPNKYSYEESTIIRGESFQVICGYCRSVVFFKKEDSVSDSTRRIDLVKMYYSMGTFTGTLI